MLFTRARPQKKPVFPKGCSTLVYINTMSAYHTNRTSQVNLPTLLEDKSLSINIFRFGRIISIKINGFSDVVIQNGIAKDGVIQVVGSVLIPPKQIDGVEQQWQGEELSVEDFKERFDPFIAREDL